MARASLPLPYFNPRTHVGCDTSQMRSVRLWNDFNPRTHVGCDRMNVSVTYSYRNFNPRTHVGCDPIQKLLCVHLLNFNPRTHVGCDENFVDTFRFFLMISIHAPTWGATYNAFTLLYSVLFQSTHPRGVRPQRFSEYKFMGDISIHAPTWGATDNYPAGTTVNQFQSTHPRGVRLSSTKKQLSQRDFNPRTHVGCDMCTPTLMSKIEISIHAPTWGATLPSLLPRPLG